MWWEPIWQRVFAEAISVFSRLQNRLEYSREELLSMPITAIYPNEMPKVMTRSGFFGYSLNGRGELS